MAREEKDSLGKLTTGVVKVTQEELTAAGVPPDLQEKLLQDVNDALAKTHTVLEARFNEEHRALQERVKSLNQAMSPTKKLTVAAPEMIRKE